PFPFSLRPPPVSTLFPYTTLFRSLSAAFFSIWVVARYGPGTAFRRALALIDAVQALVDTQATAELATDADEVRGAVARSDIAVLMGGEGGHGLETPGEKPDALYHRGARCLTLTA